jgi:hypothetical protein
MTARIHILHPRSERDTWDLPAVASPDPLSTVKDFGLGIIIGALLVGVPMAIWVWRIS